MVQALDSETSLLKRFRLRWRLPDHRRGSHIESPTRPPRTTRDESVRRDDRASRDPERDDEPLDGLGADLLAHALDPTMVIGLDGEILAANGPARVLGRSLGLPLDGSAKVGDMLARLRLRNGGGSPPWTPLETRTGSAPVPFDEPGSGVPIHDLYSTARSDADGRAIGWIVHLSDVTALGAVTRERDSAVGHRDSLLKLLSHDMRSPQAAILATLTHPDFKTVPEKLRQIIERASRRTLYMVDSVVRLVRAESEACVLEPIELAHIVEEVIDLLWSVGKSANVRFVFEPPAEEFVVLGDRSLLIQAVTDLFNNVVKYSGRGDSVVCNLTSSMLDQRPAVACEVVDRVRHLSEGELARMFSRFAPTDESDVGSMGDSDGFMFLKAVVGRHAGTTFCENLPSGGRRILITLPLSPCKDTGTATD